MALDAAHQQRLEALYDWRSGFMASNTFTGSSVNRLARGVAADMDLADDVTTALAEALAQTYGVAEAATEWDAAFVDMQADLAWLIGMHTKIKSLDDFVCLKQTMKMLTSKGTTAKHAVGQDGGPTFDTKHLISQLRKDNESAPLIQFD